MVSYKVRRLHAEGDRDRRYHLFDRADQLLLVAEQGSAWSPPEQVRQVRFARPNGDLIATMDLPQTSDRRPNKGQDYAVIFEHAVYALISAPVPGKNQTEVLFDRLVIEVEGNRWLALCWPGGLEALMVIYDAEASGLSTHIQHDSADLPEPIGLVEAGSDYDFHLTLPAGRLVQGPLLGLALVFLVDGGT
jgi:hypothetical protein